jgi:hypothetical protein
VLWQVNFPTLMLMSADAPRYVTGEKVKHIQIESEDELFSILDKKFNK